MKNLEMSRKTIGVAPLGGPQKRNDGSQNTQRGITLVALIITVIVLLILAMVSNLKTNTDISILSAIAY